MHIKVLGPGCKNCETLYKSALEALTVLEIEATVEKVTAMGEIAAYISITPGLVIDEQVVHEGKPLPTADQVRQMIAVHARGE